MPRAHHHLRCLPGARRLRALPTGGEAAKRGGLAPTHPPQPHANPRALAETLGYARCTQVQAASLPRALAGADLVVKAKTGTGKTLAFLIPAFERLRAAPPGPGHIGVLCVSPTRELASQIGVEARALATFHGFGVQVVVGGTNVNTDATNLRRRTPTILVATPGRLNDLLTNMDARPLLASLRVLVFDEADRLLDMGFRCACIVCVCARACSPCLWRCRRRRRRASAASGGGSSHARSVCPRAPRTPTRALACACATCARGVLHHRPRFDRFAFNVIEFVSRAVQPAAAVVGLFFHGSWPHPLPVAP